MTAQAAQQRQQHFWLGLAVWAPCAVLGGALSRWAWKSAEKLRDAGGDAGRIGDWLINYAGGFVRRGLAGALLHVFGKDALDVTIGLQLLLYGGLLLGALFLLWRHCVRGDFLIAALFASPATFAFEALNEEGYRKELLGFHVILTFALLIRWSSPLALRLLPWFLASFAPLVFVHEALILFLPYLVLLALCEWPALTLRSWRLVAPVVLVAVGFLVVVLTKTPKEAPAQIIDSWRGLIPDISLVSRRGTGSIRSLAGTAESGFRSVSKRLDGASFDYRTKYTYALLLTLVPFVLDARRWAKLVTHPARAVAIVVAFVMTGALALVAVDWGRFIYMNATALALVALGAPPMLVHRKTWLLRAAAFAALMLVVSAGAFWRLPISSQSLTDGWGCRVPTAASNRSMKSFCTLDLPRKKRARRR